MALKDAWLKPVYEDVFPEGTMLIGGIEPITEYNADRSKPKKQKVDLDDFGNGTGKRLWKGTVADPTGSGAKGKTLDVVFVSDVQPVPSVPSVMPGYTPVVLEGLQVKPRIVGDGQFKSIGWSLRATGIVGDNSGANQPPADVPASRPARNGRSANESEAVA
ncbi:hypothetical protein [Nocardia concava]|uniref:hypothetical protein n=1 Tax=Nocardia concava TaxID=257281 RepID=UPI0002EFB33F|nr:hypothetical protein [Nocardia concava]